MLLTRIPAVVVGLFLTALWIAGLSLNVVPWLTWLDGAGAVIAFVVAALPGAEAETAGGRGVLAGVLSLGLFALWIIGLVARAQGWMVWCTFAAACATAFVAFGGGARAVSRPV